MARQKFTANYVVGLLQCDDSDELRMQDSDDGDFLCEKGKPNYIYNLINYCYDASRWD